MNLADALRRVNSEGEPLKAGSPSAPTAPEKETTADETPSASNRVPSPTPADPETVPDPSHHHVSGNVVRLELFLSAEQMGGLFRAIMAGQHSILTLREAASYLRISQDTLVKLAEEGEIPGVHIEGRWRFPKPNLDEWLTLQSVGPEDSEDVA